MREKTNCLKSIIGLVLILLNVGLFAQQKKNYDKKMQTDFINEAIDQWHGLAAVGDTSYFDFFAEDSFYLGTDAKEVWTLQEFKAFANPYFLRGSAWNFKTKGRDIFIGEYGHYAWFHEKLDTWMGYCRGTGVLEKQGDEWKLKHYSLTVLIPNSKIKEYVNSIKD
ncbi:MAG: hypothetical protein B7C24_03940 [Bacteroidetes bacterium 4572_77]|nr:MAG: hypothetical protein B7C24_03940 [Bacteroidetes bacterium 4572_77]